ncbi:hypothetical protein SAMN06265173_101186 [Thalassovita litoralis]|uniref:Uncharacterized protein n=1 Tax=Thalassovita litoralis TaxID=1010611 RepID=A0A521AIX9_9RHOB|nr:hypothetical protein [Thalassovita litoralis]SMO34718.1 hypothetical protein SAMN06265173_101186 [Thalassovita litoralis]
MTNERPRNTASPLSRRTLLTALPASGVALAFPVSAEPVDPIMPLYHEWHHASAEWLRLADFDDWDGEPMQSLWDRKDAALERMLEIVPASTAGIAALAHVLWAEAGPVLRPDHEEYQSQCETIPNKLIGAIWKAASGKTGVPTFTA